MKRGDRVLVREVEPMWIAEIEDEFVKVRDEEGFSLRIRIDRLSWDESADMWGVISDIEPEPEQPGREGWPEFNGAFRA